MGNEVGMGGEVLFLSVLEDKEAVGGKEGGFVEDEVGQLCQLGQGVWGISKDEIVRTGGFAKKAKDISTQEGDIVFGLQGLQELTDKADVLWVQLH
jgi:hypothetical protein